MSIHYMCPVVQCNTSKPEDSATNVRGKVTCGSCKEFIRVYYGAFPPAHPEKMEGGQR